VDALMRISFRTESDAMDRIVFRVEHTDGGYPPTVKTTSWSKAYGQS